MNIFVLNRQFETIALIDSYMSFIWTERYYDTGDFELYLRASKKALEIFQNGNYIARNDRETIMIIEGVKITTDVEDGDKLTIYGRTVESILERRIIKDREIFEDKPIQEIIYRLVEKNVITPTDPNRAIPNFTSQNNGIESQYITSAQYRGENLLETIQTLCKMASIGFKVILTENELFQFSLYEGTDRSYNQDANSYVVFSSDFDNLVNSDYNNNNQNYRNTAVIVGEDIEGVTQKITETGTAIGLDRREIWVDSGDLTQNLDSEDKSEIISDGEYIKQLQQSGREALAEYPVSEAFEGEMQGENYIYGIDYTLGDIVQVVNEYGIETTPRITEIIENWDEKGTTVVPTFSLGEEE